MAKRPIIIAPDRRLKVRSEPVSEVDESIRTLLDDMIETMYASEGIGLAAIQIGEAKRCIVADVHAAGEPPAPLKLVNPEVLWRADDQISHEEGCLSFPDYFAEVQRPAEVRIGYLDETGERRELEASGVLAICLQHEIDHLEGILFVDHISMVKRSIILRKLSKAQRAAASA
jgi:peptide deformylase